MRGGGLSLFSGAGGLDWAARIAGLSVQLATDMDVAALETLRSSGLPKWTIDGDIGELLNDGWLREAWGDGAPRIILGGPPCTGFSHAGFWIEQKRNGNDPAVHLVSAFMDVVSEFHPEAFVLENVPGLAFSTHQKHLHRLIDRGKALGYHVTTALLNAAHFGTAQARRRLFVVGSRREPVSLDSWDTFPVRSARWAIGSLEDVDGHESDEEPKGDYGLLLKRIPPGKNYIHFTARGPGEALFKYRGRYWSFLLKIDPDKPSPTIPGQRVTFNGPFHWTGRHLRIAEMARLQGFPDGLNWSSQLSAARLHIGNSVPPLLGASVLWRVRQSLGDVSHSRLPPVLEHAKDETATYKSLSDLVLNLRATV